MSVSLAAMEIPQENSEGPGWAIVGVAAAVVLLGIGGFFWMRAPAAGPVVAGKWPSAQQTLRFEDGGRLEVFGLAVGEYVDTRVMPAKGIGSWLGARRSSTSSGGNSYFGAGGYSVSMNTEEEDGQLVSCSSRIGGSDALLISIRLLDPAVGIVEQERFHAGGEVNNRERRWSREDRRLGPVGTGTEDYRAALGQAGLGLLIQHEDPVSGWVNLDGPFKVNDQLEGRCLVGLYAWQRDQRDLKLRAIRGDGAVVNFTVANPDYQKVPLAMMPARSLPMTSSGTDFEVRLLAVDRAAAVDNYPLTRIDSEVSSPLTTIADMPDFLSLEMLSALDEWGNRVPIVAGGFALPGGSQRADIQMRIVRTEAYPRSVSQSVLIAEGTVSADGTRVNFKLLPDAARFGIGAAPTGRMETEETSDRSLPERLEFSYAASFPKGAAASLVSVYGEPCHWPLVFFGAGAEVSNGLASQRSGSTSVTNGSVEAHAALEWSARPGTLKPGERIRVGIARPLLPSEVVFPVELTPVEGVAR